MTAFDGRARAQPLAHQEQRQPSLPLASNQQAEDALAATAHLSVWRGVPVAAENLNDSRLRHFQVPAIPGRRGFLQPEDHFLAYLHGSGRAVVNVRKDQWLVHSGTPMFRRYWAHELMLIVSHPVC